MKRIPLLLSGADGVDYAAWPVTQGIPFANGELERGTPVRVVDENGQPMPTQTQCLATWHLDQKYVKWLLVDFQADLQAGQRRRLHLEIGPEAKSPDCLHPVGVVRNEQFGITCFDIDTGALRLGLSQEQFHRDTKNRDILKQCAIRQGSAWRELLPQAATPFLYMEDQNGQRYESRGKGPSHRITIEESGPLRACVRVEGFHAMPEGQRFCPYLLRLHLFAGKPEIRVHHTFIYDQVPEAIQLSAIGMALPLDLGEATRMTIGGTDKAHIGDPAQRLAYLQTSDNAYQVTVGGEHERSGTRPTGWATLHGTNASATAVIRDAWQEYPKGLAIDKDGIDVQIWPRDHREPLSFTTPFVESAVNLQGAGRDKKEIERRLAEHPTAPINLKSWDPRTAEDLVWIEKTVAGLAPGRPISHCDTGMLTGVGAAKTTEVWLRFGDANFDDTESERYARSVQEPLVAPADPAHTCNTSAMGHAYAAGDPRFEEVDEALDLGVDMVAIEPVERCRLYGMMRYGNLVCSHAPGPGVAYSHYRQRDPEKALRYVGTFNNEAYDMIMGVWGNFMHSGRRDHYLAAQRYSRCVADVCFIHAEPHHPDWVGLMHYHNGHCWSGGPSPSHSLISGILADYFFTGNRRLLEVARENADWAVLNQEPCGVISNRNAALHREFTGPLWSVLEVYQATWAQKYGELARRSLNWFLRTIPEPGSYPISVFTRGENGDEAIVDPSAEGHQCKGHPREIYPLFEIGQRLFDSQAIRDHIVAEADSIVWHEMVDRYIHRDQAQRDHGPGTHFWPVDTDKDDWYWMDAGRVWGTYRSAAGLVCLAYDLTHDPIYAAYAKHFLEHAFMRQKRKMQHFAFFDFSHAWYGSGIPRLMRTAATAMDRDPHALAEAEATWMRKRAELGNPIYTGPGVDLEKDHMEASGIISNRPHLELSSESRRLERQPQTSLGPLSVADHPAPD